MPKKDKEEAPTVVSFGAATGGKGIKPLHASVVLVLAKKLRFQGIGPAKRRILSFEGHRMLYPPTEQEAFLSFCEVLFGENVVEGAQALKNDPAAEGLVDEPPKVEQTDGGMHRIVPEDERQQRALQSAIDNIRNFLGVNIAIDRYLEDAFPDIVNHRAVNEIERQISEHDWFHSALAKPNDPNDPDDQKVREESQIEVEALAGDESSILKALDDMMEGLGERQWVYVSKDHPMIQNIIRIIFAGRPSGPEGGPS